MKTFFHKTFSYTLIALLAISVMVSCKKDDETSPATAAGTWKVKSFTADPALPLVGSDLTALFGDCTSKVSFTLNANGTIASTIPTDCQDELEDLGLDAASAAKWSVSGSKITIAASDNTASVYDLELSSSEMKWKVTENVDLLGTGTPTKTTLTLTFTRQ
jgi:hypothetical protein